MSEDGIKLSEAQKKRRRGRNIAVALILAGLVVMFYIVTIVKLGGNVLLRSL